MPRSWKSPSLIGLPDNQTEESRESHMSQPNMKQMFRQVQKMQEEMAKAQEALKEESVEASAGGGVVKVKMTGGLELREVVIDPQAVDPEDVELLQEMVLVAVNDALKAAQELAAGKMGSVTGGLGGLGLPGM